MAVGRSSLCSSRLFLRSVQMNEGQRRYYAAINRINWTLRLVISIVVIVHT
jgi:hypothetical protein